VIDLKNKSTSIDIKIPEKSFTTRLAVAFAAILALLQIACMAAGLRYSYISTDILRLSQASFLYIFLTVFSPLTSYLRYAVLFWVCVRAGQRRSYPFLAITVASLFISAAFEVVFAVLSDYYFAQNVGYHLTAAGLGFIIGLCATLFLWAAACERYKKLDAGKKTRFARLPAAPVYISAAAVMAAIDILYQTYILIDMALSESGVAFAEASDVWALIWDYAFPVIKSALGLVFMCFAGLLLEKLALKKSKTAGEANRGD